MRLFLMILVVVGSAVFTPTNAQTSSVIESENSVKKDGKYALLVSNARYFQAAVRTGESLKANAPEMDFEVVLVGQVVKDIVTDVSLTKTIELSKKLGIRLVVCEAAMNHMQLKKSDYHSAIEFTPDGFIYIFGLQESGYKTITL
ncbi:DsrE family protein [Gelidibacter salicanalis]|uniref:DsrE family protein n=1 Tax=Gelidibacter salicanalis TaxID=291193 RepID=A0A5C7AG98_9FLAO|nr:DsrE family protein [Gelidibacter salicanalis]TXE07367.1 DsrE family protein [Gelidibacter salicanalis]